VNPHKVQLGASLDLVQKPLQLLIANAKLGILVAGRNVRMHLQETERRGYRWGSQSQPATRSIATLRVGTKVNFESQWLTGGCL
jgi:hypothetical protein